MKYLLVLSLALTFCATAAMPTAHAQSAPAQATVEPSNAQLELNNRAVKAIVAKDYPKAVRLFRSSLDLGELNITYVNMGRAYQYMGNCKDAEKAFDKALSAPAVAQPSADKIAAVIAKYRKELKESCVPVDDSVQPTPPEVDVNNTTVTDDSEQDKTTKSVKPLPKTADSSADTSGSAAPYWLAGGGVGILGGVLLDTVPASASNGESDALDYVPPGLYVLGGAAIVYGIYTLLD